MKLRDWRRLEGLTAAAFAETIEVAHSTVLRWEDGSMFPSRENLERIQAKTGRKVTANDFMVAAEPGAAA